MEKTFKTIKGRNSYVIYQLITSYIQLLLALLVPGEKLSFLTKKNTGVRDP